MKNPRLLRTVAVFIVLLMPFCIFLYIEIYKPHPPKFLPKYKQVPYFKYIDEEGDSISSDDLKGYYYIGDFFYTQGAGSCTKMTKIMARFQGAYKTEQRVKILSFTVDPDRDSVSVLKAYADKYGSDPFKWFFLTSNSKRDIYRLMNDGFRIPVMEDPEQKIIYSDKAVLVDGDGKIRGYFNIVNDSTQIDSLFNGIEGLLVEKPQ